MTEQEADVQRKLGEHGALIAVVRQQNDEMRDDIKKILRIVDRHVGGWKAISTLLGINAIASYMIHKFTG